MLMRFSGLVFGFFLLEPLDKLYFQFIISPLTAEPLNFMRGRSVLKMSHELFLFLRVARLFPSSWFL